MSISTRTDISPTSSGSSNYPRTVTDQVGGCGLTLTRLRHKQGNGWARAQQSVQPRSAYLLRGEVRREWEHSVPPVEQLRYSVTFRNFVAGWQKEVKEDSRYDAG